MTKRQENAVLVTGGRDFWGFDSLKSRLDTLRCDAIYEGGSSGAEMLAAEYGFSQNIPVITIKGSGKKAGAAKEANRILKAFAEDGGKTVLICPDGAGSDHYVNAANDLGLFVLLMRESDLSSSDLNSMAGKRKAESLMNPEEEGATHVNFYSKSSLRLGRFLSNFSKTDEPVETPFGHFQSIEGLWYWMKLTGANSVADLRDSLMDLWGFDAKKRGQELVDLAEAAGDYPRRPVPFAVFKSTIEDAILQKVLLGLAKGPAWVADDLLKTKDLPFCHYYVYGGKAVPAGYDWLRESMETVRAKALGA